MPAARDFEFSVPALWRAPLAVLLQGVIALAAVAVGVIDLSGDAGSRQRASTLLVHMLFGLLLCTLLYVRSQRYVGDGSGVETPDPRSLARHLRRVIYLIVYLVVGTREAVALYGRLVHGTPVDFSVLDAGMRVGPDRGHWNPFDNFQLFIASVLLALVVARVLAFRTSSSGAEWNPESAE